ncbi:methyl-accepting chemotaxis protein [Luteibacter sp.]|jgi:methyl-accepting chemotaxis protein|uniref:methyl-accepting chemotaxis protein n=1 Tax=Luteibacter sp. TaxID=1886636 RepID=UPI002F41B49F
MRFTVGRKIFAAMSAGFLIALALGGVGLLALTSTFGDLDSMFHRNLLPVAQVGHIRSAIATERGAVSRALLFGTPAAADDSRRLIASLDHDIDKRWAVYRSDSMASAEGTDAARQFEGARTAVAPLMTKTLAILGEGHRQEATDLALHGLAAAFDAESAAILRNVTLVEGAAGEQFKAAEARHTRTFEISLGIIVVGLVVLCVAGWLLFRAVMTPLRIASRLAADISQGTLKHALSVTGNDELSDTLRSLATMDDTLATVVDQVREGARSVSMAAAEISHGVDDLSQRTQSQAAALEETAASMEQMAASVRQNSEGARVAETVTKALHQDAKRAADVAHSAEEGMQRIQEAASSISDIASLMDEIAFQTNLLALNAAVEAARAGEQGRGFAVVASEVRLLAQRSANSSREIRKLATETGESVTHGAELVRSTGRSLEGIHRGTSRVADIIAEIASASGEQASGVDQVVQSVSALDEMTQQNAALAEEASAASRASLERARELTEQVAFFRFVEPGV